MAGLLSTVTTLIGNARWVSASDGWKTPPNLWIAAIGDPSSGKSPALDAALSNLRILESEMAEGFSDTLREYERQKEIAGSVLEDWKGEVKEALKLKTPPPLMPESAEMPLQPTPARLYAIDATQEALGRLMVSNPKGLLCKRDELSGWLQNFDRYNSGGERAFYTEAFGGGDYSYDRVKNNGEQIKIAHLTVSVIGGLQPEKMAELLMKGSDDGFVARFLMLWPDPAPLTLSSSPPIPEKYLSGLRKLNALKMAVNDKEEDVPVVKMLSQEAKLLHFEWRKKNRDDMKEVYGLVLSHYGKLPGIVLRLAMVFEYMDWSLTSRPEPDVIGVEAIARAADLVDDYFKPMALRVYGDAALPPQEKCAAMLARRILREKCKTVNANDIRRYWKLPGLRESNAVKSALLVLVELGWLCKAVPNNTKGKSKENYHVNPAVFREQK
jgi:Protein of unknown function (DUF3987)